MRVPRLILGLLLYAAVASLAYGQIDCPTGNCQQWPYQQQQQWTAVQPAQQRQQIQHVVDSRSTYIATYDQRYPFIARIRTIDGDGASSLGTGTLVYESAAEALVLTAHHVVRDSRSITVHFPDGIDRRVTSTARGEGDIVLLRISPTGIRPCKVREAEPPAGEKLYAVGYGSDGRMQWANGAAAYDYDRQLRVDNAYVRQGDSGGPILDTRGQFVSVLWGCSRDVRGTMGCRWTPVRNVLAGVWTRLFRPVVVNQQINLAVDHSTPAPVADDPGVGSPEPAEPGQDISAINDRLDRIESLIEQLSSGSSQPGPQGPRGPAGPAGEPGPPGLASTVDVDSLPPLHVRFIDSDGDTRDETYRLGRDRMIIKLEGVDVLAP